MLDKVLRRTEFLGKELVHRPEAAVGHRLVNHHVEELRFVGPLIAADRVEVVEQQQVGAVQQAGRQRQALFPTA